MQKFLILDNKSLNNLIILFFSLSILFFLQLFFKNQINFTIFILLSFLIFVNYFSFFFYFYLKKESKNFPIFPLIIFYYLLTFTGYFYFSRDMYFVLALISWIIFVHKGLFSPQSESASFKSFKKFISLVLNLLLKYSSFLLS